MKAVNLIPPESRQRLVAPGQSGGIAYVIVGLLAAAVLLVAIDVITANTIAQRRARVGQLQRQAQSERALAARLSPYTQFAQLAAARTSTVREIAAARFDWHGALLELSRVVPAGTSLSSLVGTVAPGTSLSGPSGGVDLRGDVSAPAFELAGCAGSQDDVARLMSRLRLMSDVTRVSLEDASQGGGASSSGGCPASASAFNIVVWFEPLPTAGPDGLIAAAGGASSATSTATAGTGATSTATAGTGATSAGTAGGASGSAAPSGAAPAGAASSGTAPAPSTAGSAGSASQPASAATIPPSSAGGASK